jgi:hypothetical protein
MVKKQNIMDLEKIEVSSANSVGIIEFGSVNIVYDGEEYMFEIEEHNINGNHEVKVFMVNEEDNEVLNLNISDSGEVMDDDFVDIIYHEYQEMSGH